MVADPAPWGFLKVKAKRISSRNERRRIVFARLANKSTPVCPLPLWEGTEGRVERSVIARSESDAALNQPGF